MPRHKTTPNKKIHTTPMVDNFEKTARDLGAAALEQTEADLALVSATRALAAAAQAHEAAVTRKTRAESKLAKLRSELGISV